VTALALAYSVGALAALRFTAVDGRIALIWAPTGIAVAVLFRAGLAYWPGVFLGALACALAAFPWWVASGIAAANTLGPVVAVRLLRRFQFDPAGGRRALDAFLRAALVGTAVPATGTLICLAATGEPFPGLLREWAVGWLGDAAGMVIVAPPLLAAMWPRANRFSVRRCAALAVTAALSAVAFADLVPVSVRGLLLVPAFLMLVRVGMTERVRLASVHVLIFVGCAAAGTAAGHGPFAPLGALPKALAVWTLTTSAAALVLWVTAVMAERARAEAALAASAWDYQALVDGTPAAMVRYTAEGTLTFVNEALCDLLGLSRTTLLGQSVFQFIPEMPRAESVTDLPVVPIYSFVAGPAAGVSGLIRKSDGSGRWYRWTARLITTARGSTEFQAVGIDLTERRQAEAERAALERKMQDAQRLEALGVLAGGVAHDFNNLLAGVLGHAELAVSELPEGHPARDHLATVLNGVAQAGGLTRQLLAYSGKGRFLLRSLDLNDLIAQTTELLRLTLPKKVQLHLDLAQNLPPVTGDDGQLRQVLMNLIINAGEAIGDRAGTVTLSTGVHELEREAVSGSVHGPTAPGRFVRLIVADTGCGMDEATRAKLFDPFFTTKFAGRGLGLSAVLGIIRGHGGGICVDSRPGDGTRFTVLLPVATDSHPALDVATPAPVASYLTETPAPPPRPPRPRPVSDPQPAPDAPPGVRGLALVADDEPTVRQVGELLLKQLGFSVLTATNGQEVVALFEAHAGEVRLVLLDLMMPVMDGTEALAAIRARSAVPVILCSGYTAEAVPEQLAGDAVTWFMQKPFSRAELQHALAAVGA
jgi:PAS domain S-box-containing protein